MTFVGSRIRRLEFRDPNLFSTSRLTVIKRTNFDYSYSCGGVSLPSNNAYNFNKQGRISTGSKS